MSITVKLVNGSQKSVEVADFEITVSELKKHMEPVLDIPAGEQRIVLRGKVLKDDQVLSAVGMESGNAIHVVRAKKPSNATNASPTIQSSNTSSQQVSSSTSAVNPSNTPVSTVENNSANSNNSTSNVTQQNPASPPVNPYAALMSGFTNNTLGGQNANSTPSAFNTMNPFAGNSAGMGNYMLPQISREEMNEMSRNPMMQQMMAQMMQNPQIMQEIMQSSPYLQNMPAESRQAMIQLMSNPQFLEAAMSNIGSMNAFENPAAPSANSAATSSSTGAGVGSGSVMPNNFNFYPNMMNMPFSQPVPQPQGDPREIYRDQLSQLREMGFPNEEANIAALQQANGNIHFAIERLFNP